MQFFNRRLIWILLGIIILVLFISFSLGNRKNLSWPEIIMKDTIGFAQSIIMVPVDFIGDYVKSIGQGQTVYQENEDLKERLKELESLQVQMDLLEKENEALRELLAIDETLIDFEKIQAIVIARSPDRWQEQITLNKGSRDGVKKDMAVVTSKGLIGKVKSVSTYTSTVQLLTTMDPRFRVSSLIMGEKEIFGLVESYDYQKNLIVFNRIPVEANVPIGSKVITSGLGGIFPKGLFIGTVQSVENDPYGLTKTAFVLPATDFSNIQFVYVLKRDINYFDEESTSGDQE